MHMLLNDLFNYLNDEVSIDLNGEFINEGVIIKWEYDCFNKEFDYDETEEEHLDRIYSEDLEIIKEAINLDPFNVTDPTIEDTIISFYIEE